jgi:uncharacterized protein (TIGR02444 family)
MPDAPAPDTVVDEFWAASLELYARPDVAAACLRLQDERGLDVNLLLLCCWFARSGRGRLSEDDLATAEARAASWRRDVIEPLRAMRRELKELPDGASSPLYVELKQLELRAEREEQRLLLAGPLGRRPIVPAVADDLTANLDRYLIRHGHSADLAADLISTMPSMS